MTQLIVRLTANQLLQGFYETDFSKIRPILEHVLGRPHLTKEVAKKSTVSDRRVIHIITAPNDDTASETSSMGSDEGDI